MPDSLSTLLALTFVAALFGVAYRLVTSQMATPAVQVTLTASDEARHAAIRGDIIALERLLESHGAEIVRADTSPDELTSLHWAAATGSQEVVQFLLSKNVKADPRAARGNNFTPLHSAAMEGHETVCEMLLVAGANPDVQTDLAGYAPIHSAAWGGHVDTVQTLLDYGANVELRNYRNETPIETASRQHQDAVVDMLNRRHTT